MELEIQNGKAKKANFQNRKMRNKSNIDFTSPKEQQIYSQMQNVRVCGETGDVLADLKTDPQIVQAVRDGKLDINGTYYPKTMGKGLNAMIDNTHRLKLKGRNPNHMDISELLNEDLIDLSDILKIAVPFKL